MAERGAIGDLLAMGTIAGLLAFGLAYVMRGGVGDEARSGASRLDTHGVAFSLHAGAGRLSVRSQDGSVSREVDLSIVVDGVARPVEIGREQMRGNEREGLTASFPVSIEDGTAEAELRFAPEAENDVLDVELRVRPGTVAGEHTVALRMETPALGAPAFVAGVGEVADRASVTGSAVVLETEPRPLGLVSSRGPLGVIAVVDDATDPNDQMRLQVTSPAQAIPTALPEVTTDLEIVLGASSAAIYKTLFAIAKVPTLHVRGAVTGAHERAHVFGRDTEGTPQVRAEAGADGRFEIDVPSNVVEWYAAIDASRASALATFVPGDPRELVLDVSPGGELHVTILDPDTKKPLTARLLVHGLDGTVDPSFGPDYRASGAGPIIDSLRGDVTTPLPSGKYRVAATKGIEWSIDAKNVTIAPGRTTELTLGPRHVVPTPGVVGCDLHVHARPSFDTPVSVEDRVLSLVSSGVDFAVPTEHNIVGDYAGVIDTLDLSREFASVTGVEVTTVSRGFGHFGVFPYPLDQKVPPFKATTLGAIMKAARFNDPKHERFIQVNHPRLPKGIGYFSIIGFQPKQAKTTLKGHLDFDGLEVYNGYDEERPERVDAVLQDYWALANLGYRYVATGSSDSHRIQFHWAGYPRTMVELDAKAGDRGPLDPLAVVAAIKKGHAIVTSGPILELELGGVHPGDEITTQDDPIRGHLRVRAAPWIDATSVDIVVDGVVTASYPIPSRPLEIGEVPGTLEEAGARTIRFDRDLEIAVGPENGWIQIIVRGTRKMDDILPFMPVPPMAFTNPVWVTRSPTPPPPSVILPPKPPPSAHAEP
jgi:hypothetical protein